MKRKELIGEKRKNFGQLEFVLLLFDFLSSLFLLSAHSVYIYTHIQTHT